MKEIKCIQGSPAWYSLRKGIPTASEFGRIIQASPMEIEVPIADMGELSECRRQGHRFQHGGMELTESQMVQLEEDFKTAGKTRKYVRFTGYKASTSWDAYTAELIAAMDGWESGFKGTPDTEYGIHLEGEARAWLRAFHSMDVRDAGFCLSDCGQYGASPDGRLPDGTPVEIKCPDKHTFLKWAFRGALPDEHKAQVHGEMLCTGADRCIFLAYADSKHFAPMMIEVRRDDFTDALGIYVAKFCEHLAARKAKHVIDLPELVEKLEAEKREAVASLVAPAKPETLHQVMNRVGREAAHEHY